MADEGMTAHELRCLEETAIVAMAIEQPPLGFPTQSRIERS
jgi:hypothetical protein